MGARGEVHAPSQNEKHKKQKETAPFGSNSSASELQTHTHTYVHNITPIKGSPHFGMRLWVFSPLRAGGFSLTNRLARAMPMKNTHTNILPHNSDAVSNVSFQFPHPFV